jgi:hypothetical protein
MVLDEMEVILAKVAPLLIPPALLIHEDKFPDAVKVFERIAHAAPNPCAHIGRKYLYLSRITLIVWVLWGIDFSLFVTVALLYLFWWENGDFELMGYKAKAVIAACAAVLFIGLMISSTLLRISINLRNVCYELLVERKKSTTARRRPEAGRSAA